MRSSCQGLWCTVRRGLQVKAAAAATEYSPDALQRARWNILVRLCVMRPRYNPPGRVSSDVLFRRPYCTGFHWESAAEKKDLDDLCTFIAFVLSTVGIVSVFLPVVIEIKAFVVSSSLISFAYLCQRVLNCRQI